MRKYSSGQACLPWRSLPASYDVKRLPTLQKKVADDDVRTRRWEDVLPDFGATVLKLIADSQITANSATFGVNL
ncbi:hypothetical protein [Calothrix sp. UHCC 0171]|uniref:hypothetical protein n=1 Tax=Calothrix sp. UHCC 0171 TaxID=3110245 RepID=UPI002B2064DA|nr:hypothetical protein [Calothrix sp. UHCC 0171]MEA5573758.1 hypothetical protein [Calothrix sp. UHCC 0171]